jgi:hypothetical protein
MTRIPHCENLNRDEGEMEMVLIGRQKCANFQIKTKRILQQLSALSYTINLK